MAQLADVPEKVSFPGQEEEILKYWEKIDAFNTSLKMSEGKPEYVFYDGPPFATGLPHYGHILAGTIKDTVTRYAHQQGFHVTRRFGWDCHGLPIEFEIEKDLGIKTRDEVLAMGIAKYNAHCRSIVTRYCTEWEKIVGRLGRWIDFKNDYKTMDLSFMESVWWVFKQLFEKNLVYRGFKVMPYSTACNTPLSNFEANLNYKDVSDPEVVVAFPVVGDAEGAALLAWTTTPWTLPSNLALCVNPEFDYVRVKDKATGKVYILAEARLVQVPPPPAPPRTRPRPHAPAPAPARPARPLRSASVYKKGAPYDLLAKRTPPARPTRLGRRGTRGARLKRDSEGTRARRRTTRFPPQTPAPPPAPRPDAPLPQMKGAELKGTKYVPIFDYFVTDKRVNQEQAFRVCCDGYVTSDSGTGIVHQAPAFGEDDYRVCINHGVIAKGEDIVCPVDPNGRFTEEVPDFKGLHVKEADKEITKLLKARGRLVSSGTLVHSYPFCWRSETPLIYRAVPSWFVKVEEIKEKLTANNLQSKWVPEAVQMKRFHNWLTEARDWAVSRNRYWGTPLPIWTSEDYQEIVVVGSVEELHQLSGVKVNDLHRETVDSITIPSKTGRGVLKRIDEVFDCWFESGSMPYGQLHYPFENKELLERNLPADFIAEGLDQTRGWFYTLLVIATALFERPAFKHCVVNGLVLAADGKKMSKRLKNYPDPLHVVHEHGADALRLYLINSPVVRAEPLRFNQAGVRDVVKDVFLPWYNAYRFFVQCARALPSPLVPDAEAVLKSDNITDRWILASCTSLIKFVRQEMGEYRLYTVVPRLLKLVDDLTNWYVRSNRRRLKGSEGPEEATLSLRALYEVLLTLSTAMAPFTPFLAEAFYQNLKALLPAPQQQASVHFCEFPKPNEHLFNPRIEEAVSRMQTVIELGRGIRDRRKIPLKLPVKEVIVVHKDGQYLADIRTLEAYVQTELNVKGLRTVSDEGEFVRYSADAESKVLGPKLGKALGAVAKAIKALTHEQVKAFIESGSITLEGHALGAEDIKVVREFKSQGEMSHFEADGDGRVLVLIDCREDASLREEGTAREVVNRVQKLRKEAGLLPEDDIEVFLEVSVTCFSIRQLVAAPAPAPPGPARPSPRPAPALAPHRPAPPLAPHRPAPARPGPSPRTAPALGPDPANFLWAPVKDPEGSGKEVARVLETQADFIAKSLSGRPVLPGSARVPCSCVLASAEREINASKFVVTLTRAHVVASSAAVKAAGADPAAVQWWLASRDYGRLQKTLAAPGSSLEVHLDGKLLKLTRGKEVFLTVAERLATGAAA
eukprot:tig00020904_g15189.t1